MPSANARWSRRRSRWRRTRSTFGPAHAPSGGDRLCAPRDAKVQPTSSHRTKPIARWTDSVFPDSARRSTRLLGILPGEGIGPEVLGAALRVLAAAEPSLDRPFEKRTGGAVGREAEAAAGRTLTDDVSAFCEGIFAEGGAVLCGPGGGRFVYDLRRRFDLYCKISPLRPLDPLSHVGRLKVAGVAGSDILILRENTGGVYQ